MNLKIIGSASMFTKHNSASYLIDNKILVDIPNGTCKELRRIGVNPNNIENVLITHFHGDHYFDMPFYLLGKVVNKEIDNSNIYCSKDGIKKIKTSLKISFPNSIKKIHEHTNINYITTKNFDLDKYKVQKIPVDHGDMKPAYGYIFLNNNKCVGFTGDTSLCDAVEYMASACHHLICDCALVEGNKKHMGIDNIIYLANKYKKCEFLLSHINDKTREELKNISVENITILNDGDVFNF